MRLLTRRKTPTEELKDVAIEALINALDDDKRAAKPGMTGVRALAAGAVIYAAGHAAFKGQRFVREQLSSDTDDDQAEDLEDEEETRAYEEPEGEEYEVDEEDDEPEEVEDDEEPESYEEDAEPEEVEEDEEPETYEDDEEPEAYEDDDEEPEEVEEDEEPEAYEDDEEPEAYEDDEEPEAYEDDEDEPDERKPMRRAARKKGAQPSLKLPTQRRARIRMSKG